MPTILESYKKKSIEILKMVYNGKVNEVALEKYVQSKIDKVKDKKIIAKTRNVYRYIYEDEVDANTYPEIVERDHLNILSNGAFTANEDPMSSTIIHEWKATRKKLKKLELIALQDGRIDDWRDYKNREVKVKQNTNSIYGASTMDGSFVSSVDIGSAITSCAQNFIAEQIVAVERFLAANMLFEDLNEAFSYFQMLFKIKNGKFTPEMMDWISYIPTPEDCRKRFILLIHDIDHISTEMSKIHESVFLFFEMMEDWKRVAFFYANNPLGLFAYNPKIRKLIESITLNDISFINPYIFPKSFAKMSASERIAELQKTNKNKDETYSLDEAQKLNDLYENLNPIIDLMRVFCFAPIIAYNRVIKMTTRKRKVCILFDTDSCMPTTKYCVESVLNIINRNDLRSNKDVTIKISMVFISIIQELLDDVCLNFAICCNSQTEGRELYLKMKNEFYFSSVLSFQVKKNYLTICELDEGAIVPPKKQLAITGTALGSSNVNSEINKMILDALENKVLRNSDNYNPYDMIKVEHEITDYITKKILEDRDKSLGTRASYNGFEQLKNPEQSGNTRAIVSWNLIMPDDEIIPGDKAYVFDTSLLTLEDLDKIDDRFADIKHRIRENIFKPNRFGMDFSRFGLKAFALPVDGETLKIPEWIIPFIDIPSIVNKHLHPLIALNPSLLLSTGKYKGTGASKLGLSNLVRF